MADDPKKRGKPDRIRIHVNQPHERRYWCKRLEASHTYLKWLVKKVGPMVKDVKAEMIRRIEAA